ERQPGRAAVGRGEGTAVGAHIDAAVGSAGAGPRVDDHCVRRHERQLFAGDGTGDGRPGRTAVGRAVDARLAGGDTQHQVDGVGVGRVNGDAVDAVKHRGAEQGRQVVGDVRGDVVDDLEHLAVGGAREVDPGGR